MQRRWTVPVAVGLWVVGCGLFDFPAPERAPDGSAGGEQAEGGSSGSKGDTGGAGTSVGGAAGDTGSGGSSGATGGDAGAGDGGTSGTGTGGTAGNSGTAGATTGGAGGDAGAGGDGPTLPVTGNLTLWLDATDFAGSTTPIGTWTNRANSAEPDATQTSLQRPVPTTVGGHPGVRFDGAQWMTFGEGFEDFTNGLTFVVVAQFETPGDCNELLQFSNGPEIDDIGFQADINAMERGAFLFEVGNTNVGTTAHSIDGPDPKLVAAVVTVPNAAVVLVDGVSGGPKIDSGFIPYPIPRGENYLGYGLYQNCDPFAGVLFELLLYARTLSVEELGLVNGYLRDKWQCCGG